jgi:hypothetical protein
MKARASIVFWLLLSGLGACADQDARRARAYAALPDWSGLWEVDLGDNASITSSLSGRSPSGHDLDLATSLKFAAPPPYKPEPRSRYELAVKDTATLEAYGARAKVCRMGFPAIVETFNTLQWAIAPSETLIVFADGTVRHIYTDGRAHPSGDDLWPTALGDSIGHWQGKTLLVDTIAPLPAPVSPFAPMVTLSDHARFTERIRMTNPNRIEDELTIEDPAFEHPWVVVIGYRRIEGLNRMIAYDCAENDRNPVVDGKLTISPP